MGWVSLVALVTGAGAVSVKVDILPPQTGLENAAQVSSSQDRFSPGLSPTNSPVYAFSGGQQYAPTLLVLRP